MLLDLLRLSRAVGEASSGKLSGKLIEKNLELNHRHFIIFSDCICMFYC